MHQVVVYMQNGNYFLKECLFIHFNRFLSGFCLYAVVNVQIKIMPSQEAAMSYQPLEIAYM